jgi:hypothetical protein
MIRAASRGIVDFSRANVRDINWWRRVNMLIQRMEQDDKLPALFAELVHLCGLVGISNLEGNVLKEVTKAAGESVQDLRDAVTPWFPRDKIVAAEIEQVGELYRSVFGDPNSPEFQSQFDAYVQDRQATAAEALKETEDQRVDRRMREQEAEREKKQRSASWTHRSRP